VCKVAASLTAQRVSVSRKAPPPPGGGPQVCCFSNCHECQQLQLWSTGIGMQGSYPQPTLLLVAPPIKLQPVTGVHLFRPPPPVDCRRRWWSNTQQFVVGGIISHRCGHVRGQSPLLLVLVADVVGQVPSARSYKSRARCGRGLMFSEVGIFGGVGSLLRWIFSGA